MDVYLKRVLRPSRVKAEVRWPWSRQNFRASTAPLYICIVYEFIPDAYTMFYIFIQKPQRLLFRTKGREEGQSGECDHHDVSVRGLTSARWVSRYGLLYTVHLGKLRSFNFFFFFFKPRISGLYSRLRWLLKLNEEVYITWLPDRVVFNVQLWFPEEKNGGCCSFFTR